MKRLIFVVAISINLMPISAIAYDDDAIKAHCDAKWNSDFAMIKYCRNQQRAAGQAYDSFRVLAEQNETVETILNHCESKWAKDYSMVNYCFEQQSSALQRLNVPAEDVPSNIQKSIVGKCAAKWGDDFSMVAYCVDQQTTAWRSLQ